VFIQRGQWSFPTDSIAWGTAMDGQGDKNPARFCMKRIVPKEKRR